MAQQTICDRCHAEIPMGKVHRVKRVLVLTDEREKLDGNVSCATIFSYELCDGCTDVIRKAVGAVMVGGKCGK